MMFNQNKSVPSQNNNVDFDKIIS